MFIGGDGSQGSTARDWEVGHAGPLCRRFHTESCPSVLTGPNEFLQFVAAEGFSRWAQKRVFRDSSAGASAISSVAASPAGQISHTRVLSAHEASVKVFGAVPCFSGQQKRWKVLCQSSVGLPAACREKCSLWQNGGAPWQPGTRWEGQNRSRAPR
jgi:hypothetical protein